MSENETVMEVCAEWRACIEAADPAIWGDPRIAGLVRKEKDKQIEYANRIEAAWRRERDMLMAEPRSWEECVERAMKVKEDSDVLY